MLLKKLFHLVLLLNRVNKKRKMKFQKEMARHSKKCNILPLAVVKSSVNAAVCYFFSAAHLELLARFDNEHGVLLAVLTPFFLVRENC
jgi:hypothetical protein